MTFEGNSKQKRKAAAKKAKAEARLKLVEDVEPEDEVEPAQESIIESVENRRSGENGNAVDINTKNAPSAQETPAGSIKNDELSHAAPIGRSDSATASSQTNTHPSTSFLRSLELVNDASYLQNMSAILWLWSLRAPLFLLGAIAVCPKLILLWVFIIIAKPITMWIYGHCPATWKAQIKPSLPASIRNSVFFQDLNEGADQGLPFIIFWLYLCCAPFAFTFILVHWLKGFFHKPVAHSMSEGCFVFTQNRKTNDIHSDSNFYHSRAFGIVLLAFFACGIPAFFSYAVYETLGIDRIIQSTPVKPTMMANASTLPKVTIPKMGLATRRRLPYSPQRMTIDAPTGADARNVVGYSGYWPWIRNLGIEPTKSSLFFVHFYLASLGSALCILFFRAWFLFPLNFLCDEHDVEFTHAGIKRKNLKSWFLSVITINRWATGGGPDSLKWSEVKSLRSMEEGYIKLCPLPETAFKKESLSYKLLNKMAAFIDGLSKRLNTGNYLVFSGSVNGGDFGTNIKINLNDLNREQRARLCYVVKKWAPHIAVHKSAEEQLIGSTVLQNVRYTQLWFDLLTSRTKVKRQTVLSPGEALKDGEYTIVDRISSGGQATTYLATKASGQKCVLKEFILSTASTSGALVESAREFEAEVSLLSQLNHPGIVGMEDFFSEDGRVYVSLEYIQGQTLRQLIQQGGPLSESEVVRISQSIGDVLQYLHGLNPPIVHRDITPENILVRPDGTIKVIDFSLAVRQDGQQTTDSCAKQAFTPPEQFREEVCVQSDIYALGATMYFLLTGLTPKPISISSPKTKLPGISAGLNSVVERATQLDLIQRYESVHWLKLDLEALNEQLSRSVRQCPGTMDKTPVAPLLHEGQEK